MTAKTDQGVVISIGKKEYWEIGIDLDGRHRVGAWQIKEIVDLTLPPRKTITERFLAELPAGTKSAEIEVRVSYLPASKVEIGVARIVKRLIFSM
ncbi:MAG: hypothetical protein HZA17_10450 [Nitrospirae bacterium]|nr:hypothetical protein [Nitrospirota bacterium]